MECISTNIYEISQKYTTQYLENSTPTSTISKTGLTSRIWLKLKQQFLQKPIGVFHSGSMKTIPANFILSNDPGVGEFP